MGDFGSDTAVEGGDGVYHGRLSRDWEIWGPNGGYVAAIALRAAGAHSRLPVPASLHLHFVGVAEFDEVTILTETIRAGKRSESLRTTMTQGDRTICTGLVWTVAEETAGPEFDWTDMPAVGEPEDTPTMQERLPEGEVPFPFWNNFDFRPLDWMSPESWERDRPQAPRHRGWYRFLPQAVFEDPYVEAARTALLVDTMGWPAAVRALSAEHDGRWIAPNMDLAVSFHRPPAGSEYLLCESEAPISAGGLIGARAQVWARDGRLLASGTQQMLFRPTPGVPNA